MDPLMIPKSCIIQGEKITIRYQGDIVIENDLVPLSIKSDEGGIRFRPQNNSVSCSHLSAEQGILEIEGERLEADTLTAKTAIIRAGELEIHQFVQTSEELLIEAESLKAQSLRANELELTAANVLELQNVEVVGDLVMTFDRGKVTEIKGRKITIKAGASFECERIVASEEVIFASGSIAVKFIDAPRITADPSVKGIVILTNAEEVRAEGVRGFIRPNEFKMLTDQGPLLALTSVASEPSDRSFDWAQGPAPDPPSATEPESEPEGDGVTSMDLDFEELEAQVEEEATQESSDEPEEIVHEDIDVDAEDGEFEDVPETDVEEDVPPPLIEDEADADVEEDVPPPLIEDEADADVEDDVPPLMIDEQDDTPPPLTEIDEDIPPPFDETSESESAESIVDESVEQIKTVNMDDEVEDFMTREIRDFNPNAQLITEDVEPEQAEDDDMLLEGDDEVSDSMLLDDDDDEILEIDIPSEEVEFLPEITDFDDLPELNEGDVSLNEDANSGPIGDVPSVAPIPDDYDEQDSGEDEAIESEDDVIDDEPLDGENVADNSIDQSMHLEETYTPTDFDAAMLEENEGDSDEDIVVSRLNAVLDEIKECFPDVNYPKFINQIQSYLDERRFSILRKKRNMEAVLNSFDRLKHARISELARDFYAVLIDHFGDEF